MTKSRLQSGGAVAVACNVGDEKAAAAADVTPVDVINVDDATVVDTTAAPSPECAGQVREAVQMGPSTRKLTHCGC